MTETLDALETRAPATREAALLAALPAQIGHAQQHSAAFGAILAGVDAGAVTSRAALAGLPVTRKSELLERQKAQRASDAFGGFATIGWASQAGARRTRRVFQSPGPIYEPEGEAGDYWRMARAIRAAGFRAGDLVHNSFSYHLTPAGSMMETGALALGCTVFPGGVGNTELQLQAIAELKPAGYIGTPSFLKILVDKAAETGVDIGSVRKALVSGEAFPPSLRDWLRERGIEGYQCYATADLGLIAYETPAREGLVIDEGVVVEIVRPGTGDPVPDGEVGELVITTLNPDYPLIRFGTGDLSAVLPGACPSGRSNTRIKGWLGRADQTTKVRGMFVHPSQVAEVVRRHPALLRARLVVEGEMANDRMTLKVEVADAPAGLAEQVAHSVRDVTKLRAEVELLAPGSLPNDGKVIEDARSYH
ncbi:putative phenylacetate-CoA ligase [Leptothrix cholodnii SP-6]|uniref:Putative phenylacetate-CoA ligase n=1 Tax=Leptothrix cholodnii (strain ATCC 51168 / LMG 8142 / SP-6) TaxID=395495 RepID=B1Y343_LEPCP|nr:AMP-binding protein [Leptothrix cholodnii]ACB35699.1 putative phenylacetate-CoA ligase [Leptothrix cholodnii SP-6]